jgi:hypothetical protein
VRELLAKLLFGLCLAIGLSAAPAFAQGATPMVIVPDHPGGVPVNGCFRANQTLFGPYQFNFCLHRPGSYTVRGGGVRCDGRMDWTARGQDIQADIRRSSCGGGVAWERATMDCRPAGRIFGPIGQLIIQQLRCTYRPSVRFKGPRVFTASRM